MLVSPIHRRLFFALGCWLALLTCASAADWDERLARKFSGRLKAIDIEIARLSPQLDSLPKIPVDDQGGTGGFAVIHRTPAPEENPYTIEIRWPSEPVEMIALVPARRYAADGLDPHYGLPEAFDVELIDADGSTLATLARETDARADPVRAGHPFIYKLDPPQAAAGLRIRAHRLVAGDEGYIHAWAEAMAFSGTRNLAAFANARATGGSTPSAPWQWNAAFLTDGQTPLGLPEIPGEDHRNVGWLSRGMASATQTAALAIDLGEAREIDGLRLLPARRPTSDLPSGFGFPRRLEIAVADTPTPQEWRIVATPSFGNPGHNPVWIPMEPMQRARHVRITATELWKAFESYPAFFALSELEVYSAGENVALGKAVRSADGMPNLIAPGGRYWSSAALIDGFGPDGKLVPTREWMMLLDRRLALETRIHTLHAESAGVIRDWRNGALFLFAILGLAGAIASIALPIRYRIQSHRQLLGVRERIAGDLHDEVGSNLGSIQMFADLAESRTGPSDELKRIQRIAAETVSAVRDIVWLLRPGGDHRIGTVEHLRETASIMVESLDWNFSADESAWPIELSEEANRHLFLYFREALHNILRHSEATRVDVRVEIHHPHLRLRIHDNGRGIPAAKLDRPATLRALRQRATALQATFEVKSTPESGTTLILGVPLGKTRR